MHKIRTAIFVLDMLPIHRQLDMCFAHEKSADCAKSFGGASASRRHHSKGVPGRQAPPRFVQKSSAEPREVYIGTPSGETAIVNKKPIKTEGKRSFPTLIP
jgi:hypothetical protein